ncbi:MAG TPA: cupin domain-containing protein [Actinophytocola sp.]|uniref:cupin domain-containing protein n=1 Tax=Actinophytocola sp. TaxID=1872138 RepID=UPI002DDCF443|nr:cupin domain-containing protein [Actinophytocola sp.]HEV2781770.1 cupin domain-containing protein [Actinophytocola sp.]
MADLVFPQPVDEFRRNTYGKTWALYEGDESRFHGVAGWETLNAILASVRFETPRFRLARGGELIPVETYTELIDRRGGPPYRRIVAGRLLEELRKGASLTVDRADHADDAVRRLTAALEAELRAEVFANIFASWLPIPAFNVHWDDQDVFAVQLSGRKHWRIFGPTRQWPLVRDSAENQRPAGPPVAEFDVTAGDVLYLPHGWWHSVSAVGEPSLHLTIGVIPDSGIDFMRWLVDRATANELIRQRLPRFAGEDERRAYLAAVRDYWNQALTSTDVLEQFFTYADGTSHSLPRFDLPDILSSNTVLDRKKARVLLLATRATVDRTGDGFVLTGLGRRWSFPPVAKPVIDAVLSHDGVTVGEVVDSGAKSDVSEEQVAEILFTLLRAGVIVLR